MIVHQEIYYEIGDATESNRFFHESLTHEKFSTWQETEATIQDLMKKYNLPREAYAIAKIKINIERME